MTFLTSRLVTPISLAHARSREPPSAPAVSAATRSVTIDEARREGLEPWHLKGASWKRVGPAIYLWIGLADTPLRKIQAALKRIPQGSAFSGLTAAWLHGLDVEPCNPIEVTVPLGVGVSSRAGIAVRRAALESSHLTTIRGMRATSLLRTIADVCSRPDLIEAVVVADMALHMRRVGLADLAAWAGAHRGRGIRTSAASSAWRSRRRSHRWRRGCEWFSCWADYPGPGSRCRFTIEPAGSRAGRISTTRSTTSGSSTTAEPIATRWRKTTAARTSCSMQGYACSDSQPVTFSTVQGLW